MKKTKGTITAFEKGLVTELDNQLELLVTDCVEAFKQSLLEKGKYMWSYDTPSRIINIEYSFDKEMKLFDGRIFVSDSREELEHLMILFCLTENFEEFMSLLEDEYEDADKEETEEECHCCGHCQCEHEEQEEEYCGWCDQEPQREQEENTDCSWAEMGKYCWTPFAPKYIYKTAKKEAEDAKFFEKNYIIFSDDFRELNGIRNDFILTEGKGE